MCGKPASTCHQPMTDFATVPWYTGKAQIGMENSKISMKNQNWHLNCLMLQETTGPRGLEK
jgi:hypothetical protein